MIHGTFLYISFTTSCESIIILIIYIKSIIYKSIKSILLKIKSILYTYIYTCTYIYTHIWDIQERDKDASEWVLFLIWPLLIHASYGKRFWLIESWINMFSKTIHSIKESYLRGSK